MPSLSPHSSHDLTQDEVLKRDIPWETYMSTKLISGTGLQLLRRYDHRPEHVQAALLDESGAEYIQLFSGILSDITKEETVEYVLALIDDMLSANPQRTQLFYDKSLSNDNVYLPFLRLLSKNNWFIQEKCCKILTLVISARPKVQRGVHGKERESEVSEILESLIDWLCNQLRKPHEVKGITAAMSFLAILLRESHVRILFMKADGVRLLGPLIKPASTQQSVQLLYEAMLCIWLLSFYDAALDAIATARILPRMVEALKSSTKEKVVRVTVLALKNLVNRNTFAADMVDLGLLKIVQGLKLQAWNDEDLLEALDSLEVSLKTNIRTLSSFDKYKQEVLSGNLEWTPVHKDQVFWRENIKKFEDNDFQVLRVLITILNSSSEPKSLAVACHDVSQFIQNHPSGRLIAIDLKAKDEVMRLMTHESPQVRKEALICVQKLLLSSKFASYMQS